MPNKKNKKKSKKGKRNKSESSTPQSSTPSVEDERQQLLQGGACGSGVSHESRSIERVKGQRTGQGNPSPCQSPGATSSTYVSDFHTTSEESGSCAPRSPSTKQSSSRSTGAIPKHTPQSGHSSEMDPPTVPDRKEEACVTKSPKSFLGSFKKFFTSEKSPERSFKFECNCKDKKKHKANCPALETLAPHATDVLGSKSTKSSNELKPPSNASPIVSKKGEGGTQSSSSSDPSVADYFRNATESEQSSGRSLLTVPGQESTEDGSSGAPRNDLLSQLKNSSISKRKSPNRSSDTTCCCKDKTNHEVECSNRKMKETGAIPKSVKSKSSNPSQTVSEASSSSSSPIVSKKSKDCLNRNVSSGNSRSSNSKSSSRSDPTARKLIYPETNNSLKSSSGKSSIKSISSTTSRNKTDYDPQEGTSRGPARYEHDTEHPGVDNSEIVSGHTIPIIQGVDCQVAVGRPRIRSLGSYIYRFPSMHSRSPSPRRSNLRNLSIRLGRLKWNWLEERGKRDRNDERDATADQPDERESSLLGKVKTVRPSPVRRHESTSPVIVRKCTCRARNGIGPHEIGCATFIDLRKRRKWKRCRQTVNLVKPKKDPDPRAKSPRKDS